jgi:carboxymethylenebutenolidase
MARTILRAAAAAILVLSAAGLSAQAALPPLEADAKARLAASPRHGEWVRVEAPAGDRVDAFVVYPERSDKAPVVIVIHEIFGLTDWVRAVADQFAAEGFIAVAPDFLSGKAPGGEGSSAVAPDAARQLIGSLQQAEIVSRLNAVASWAARLPAASGQYAVVGYCWGGGISFQYAAEQPAVSAAVVYYGTSPSAAALARIRAPVLGLYGGDDARVNATVGPAQEEMRKLGRRYDVETYEKAGHAFLRQQDGRDGANLRAAQKAWPRTLEFLRQAMPASQSTAEPFQALAAAARADVACACEEEPGTSLAALAPHH